MNPTPKSIRPRAVVFDLGKVLLDFDYTRVARALSPHSSLSAVDFKRVVDQSPLLFQYETGELTSAEFEAAVRRLTGYTGTTDHFRQAFGDIFTEIAEMIALQQELREREIPTYIFSNTNELAVDHIRTRYPFFSGFTGYVFSYEIGAMKPAASSYAAVERLTGLRGRELVYLDDRPENVAGAVPLGWHGILHTSPGETRVAVARLLEW